MDWSEEEKRILFETWAKTHEEDAEVLAIATRAVELAASRGGTMTAEELAGALHDVRTAVGPHHADGIAAHISTLGARNAMLEADARDAKVACDRLAENVDGLKERLSAAEEGNRELVRRAQQAEGEVRYWQKAHAEAKRAAEQWKTESEHNHAKWAAASLEGRDMKVRLATLSAAGQVTCPHDPRGGPCDDCAPMRYPCSPTCTHDDAPKPGHPERVKERGDAFTGTAAQLEDVMRRSHDDGVEAMRAACWEAVRSRLHEDGMTTADILFQDIKAAIEGAAP